MFEYEFWGTIMMFLWFSAASCVVAVIVLLFLAGSLSLIDFVLVTRLGERFDNILTHIPTYAWIIMACTAGIAGILNHDNWQNNILLIPAVLSLLLIRAYRLRRGVK